MPHDRCGIECYINIIPFKSSAAHGRLKESGSNNTLWICNVAQKTFDLELCDLSTAAATHFFSSFSEPPSLPASQANAVKKLRD